MICSNEAMFISSPLQVHPMVESAEFRYESYPRYEGTIQAARLNDYYVEFA